MGFRWPSNPCCRQSKLAEFVNGTGSMEKHIQNERDRHQMRTGRSNSGQPTPPQCCYPPRPESPPTHVVYIPICPSRSQQASTPRTNLSGIDTLEDLIPSLKSTCCCCDCECCVVDPCSCTSSRNHRITFEDACPPPPITKWPHLPLPKLDPRNPLNPCPPECDSPSSSSDDEDADEKDNQKIYHFNKKTGRFEPGPPPASRRRRRRRPRPQVTVIEMEGQCPCPCPCPCEPPPPCPGTFPNSWDPFGGPCWDPCDPCWAFPGETSYGGAQEMYADASVGQVGQAPKRRNKKAQCDIEKYNDGQRGSKVKVREAKGTRKT